MGNCKLDRDLTDGSEVSNYGAKIARKRPKGASITSHSDDVDASSHPKSETLYDLKQLATARQALIKDRTAAKARLGATTHRLLSQQIKRRLSQIERDLSQIADLLDTTIAADDALRAKADILVSIPGIAKVTACAILTDMPELGALSGKQAAKPAGLAPISKQSGKWQGKAGHHSRHAQTHRYGQRTASRPEKMDPNTA